MPRRMTEAMRAERLLEAMETFRRSTTQHGMERYSANRRALLDFIAGLDQRASGATLALRAVCDIASEEGDAAAPRIIAAIQRARAAIPPA
jgi:hypothetical protein